MQALARQGRRDCSDGRSGFCEQPLGTQEKSAWTYFAPHRHSVDREAYRRQGVEARRPAGFQGLVALADHAAVVCENIEHFGGRPNPGEPDPRAVRDESETVAGLDTFLDAFADEIAPDGTRFFGECESLRCGFVNTLHMQMTGPGRRQVLTEAEGVAVRAGRHRD